MCWTVRLQRNRKYLPVNMNFTEKLLLKRGHESMRLIHTSKDCVFGELKKKVYIIFEYYVRFLTRLLKIFVI